MRVIVIWSRKSPITSYLVAHNNHLYVPVRPWIGGWLHERCRKPGVAAAGQQPGQQQGGHGDQNTNHPAALWQHPGSVGASPGGVPNCSG